jgi:hypothetical protein
MKASRDGGGGLLVGSRDDLKVLTADRRGEARIGDLGASGGSDRFDCARLSTLRHEKRVVGLFSK